MAEVLTRDEALALLRSGLLAHARDTLGLLHIAGAQFRTALAKVDAVVGERARDLAFTESQLARHGDDPAPEPLQAAVVAAAGRLSAARTAQALARSAQADFDRYTHQTHRVIALAEAAATDLVRRGGSLQNYHTHDATQTPGAPTATAAASHGGLSAALGARSLANVDVSQVTFADNPILDNFTRGGLTHADYTWLVEAWDTVVGPGLARGLTRDDFAARDEARGARAPRRTVDVWDVMLGTNAIRVSQRPDGTWDVGGGRHRIQIAQELGVTHLPARVV